MYGGVYCAVFGEAFGTAFGFGDAGAGGWVHSRLDDVKWYMPKIVNMAIRATARHLLIERPIVDWECQQRGVTPVRIE